MTYSRSVQSDSVTPNTSDREEVQIDFVATSTAGERNYQAATERAVPFGAGGPSSQNNPGKTNVFQLAHYQRYFNVDTSVRSLCQPVLIRLRGAQCLLLACSSLHRSPVAGIAQRPSLSRKISGKSAGHIVVLLRPATVSCLHTVPCVHVKLVLLVCTNKLLIRQDAHADSPATSGSQCLTTACRHIMIWEPAQA